MRKNKNYKKIFGMFILVFICFSFFSNITIATAYWEYKNPDKTQSQICEYANTDEAGCNARVKSVCGPTTTGVCVPSPDGCNSGAVAVDCPTPDVQTITPKTTDPANTYTLLAPIGNLTTAPNNFGDYVNTIFKIAIGLCAALAVIMIVIGGIQYMGDESIFGKTEAKSSITRAILGLLIALGAYALLNTINPDLLKSNINIKQVSADITEAPILSDTGKTVPVGTKNSFSGCPGGVSSTLTKGGSFIFCTAYASKLQAMFVQAYTDGYIISGGGFRTYDEQVAARTTNCPAPILTVPASSCKPPTAIPGTSNHEQGLALDLKCDGFLINWDDQQKKYTKTPATKKCFDWLTTNASKYGFSNLAIENWHWSTGPNAGH